MFCESRKFRNASKSEYLMNIWYLLSSLLNASKFKNEEFLSLWRSKFWIQHLFQFIMSVIKFTLSSFTFPFFVGFLCLMVLLRFCIPGWKITESVSPETSTTRNSLRSFSLISKSWMLVYRCKLRMNIKKTGLLMAKTRKILMTQYRIWTYLSCWMIQRRILSLRRRKKWSRVGVVRLVGK